MTNTAEVHVAIDPEIKEKAETILEQVGITPAEVIRMLYSRIIKEQKIPFEPCLPAPKILFEGSMTREEIDRELQKGIDSIEAGRTYTLKESEEMLAEFKATLSEEYGI